MILVGWLRKRFLKVHALRLIKRSHADFVEISGCISDQLNQRPGRRPHHHSERHGGRTHNLRLGALVSDKLRLVDYSLQRRRIDPAYRYEPTGHELFDDLPRHLFSRLHGRTDKHFNRLKASVAPLIRHHLSAKTFLILTTA